jgi:hypothetical protein
MVLFAGQRCNLYHIADLLQLSTMYNLKDLELFVILIGPYDRGGVDNLLSLVAVDLGQERAGLPQPRA